MAKEDKAKKAAPEKAEAPEFKYGVADLADKLDLAPSVVRQKLRSNDVEKAGKSYGWNTKAELQEVVDLISAEKKSSKKDDKKPAKKDDDKKSSKKGKEDDKPAKKKPAKKKDDED